ncbi:MAG: RtcB family protein [Planctomycetota bacterium]|jgi:tRNA-splicing ligase RtcB
MRTDDLKPVAPAVMEVPRQGKMRVPVRFVGGDTLLDRMDDKVREQILNVAHLPGIVGAAMCMPDAHWGYGFPIGGVAAFDAEEGGVLSVGGVGFDISCGVRLYRTGLTEADVAPEKSRLADRLFETVPAGVGREGKIRLDLEGIDGMLRDGARWAVAEGYGPGEELEFVEENGCIEGARPEWVSKTAKKRQRGEMGTLGSGNHYLEVQVVEHVDDDPSARAFGLARGDVVVMIHCGSRALGHQIGTDYLSIMAEAAKRYGIPYPERELACAPIQSPEGERYYGAVCAGVNCALANRQVIGGLVHRVFDKVFPGAKLRLVYDVSHNTCKVEEHEIDGERRRLHVHRKGATRAWGPGHPDLVAAYREVGQPVFIGGTMGTRSYVLRGTRLGEERSYSSTCHGAGRAMSRRAAKRRWSADEIQSELERQGITLRAASRRGVVEEAPGAYKDVEEVVEAAHQAGISAKVCRLRPIACIKG